MRRNPVCRAGQGGYPRLPEADYEWDVLVADKAAAQRKYPGAVIDPASIDDIMLLYIKGVQG